jgi:glutamate-1-semialdehyde aminotransferase
MPDGIPNSWFRLNYDHPPVYVDGGKGAYFTDVDGHRYLDMMLGISGAFCGHAPEPVAEAGDARAAPSRCGAPSSSEPGYRQEAREGMGDST